MTPIEYLWQVLVFPSFIVQFGEVFQGSKFCEKAVDCRQNLHVSTTSLMFDACRGVSSVQQVLRDALHQVVKGRAR